ncbi:hypothetical protein K9N50_11535 [bacterium]|nr:hypothetical protein [bacterium]
MYNQFQKLLILSIITIFIFSSVASAQFIQSTASNGKPIQIALFNPVQLLPENESIKGVRLSLVYGKNTSLTGLDWAFLVNHLTAPSIGIQWSMVGYNESDFSGWQEGLISVTKGSFLGLQSGFVNIAGDATGVQYGFVNYADKVEGVQLGFVNYVNSMYGLQIGLANIIRQGGIFPVMPIINFSF